MISVKNILLTGASGYVGSSFSLRYRNKYKINFFSFLKDDFSSLQMHVVDVVLHCSALVHNKNATYEEFEQVNVQNTIKLAQKAKANGVKHFIFISTIAVYGENYCTVSENLSCEPISLYGKSKLKAEAMLRSLEDDVFLVSIIRSPMIYGKNAPGNIQSLMQLIKIAPSIPFAKICNKRSFVYIGNLCALIDCIIQKQQRGIFLASDDTALSTTQLIEHIVKAKKKTCWLFRPPLFSQLLKWLRPSLYKRLFESLEIDNQETKRLLAFENPYTVEEGIGFMVHGEKQ